MATKTPRTLAQRLLAVQRALPKAKRNQDNGEYAWADLASVVECCVPLLHKHGLLVTWHPTGEMVGGVFMAKVSTNLNAVDVNTQSGRADYLAAVASCPC